MEHDHTLTRAALSLLSLAYCCAACGTDPGVTPGQDAADTGIDSASPDGETDTHTPDAATDVPEVRDAADANGNDDALDGDDGEVRPDVPAVFDGFAEAGWGQSTTPLCVPDNDGPRFESRIWASDSLVAVTRMVASDDGDTPRIQIHRGRGWTELATDPSFRPASIGTMRGLSDSTLWLAAQSNLFGVNTSTGAVSDLGTAGVVAFHVASSTNACALVSAAPGVLWYNVEWQPLPGDPLPFDVDDLHAIWCDAAGQVHLAGRNGTVLSRVDDGWRVHDTGVAVDLTAIWGNHDQVWAVGVDSSLLHYRDGLWSAVAWAPPVEPNACRGDLQIGTLSGGGDAVFVTTSSTIARVDSEGRVQQLADWSGSPAADGSCAERLVIRDAWSPDGVELFVVTDEVSDRIHACEEYVIHYDGTRFHWI